MARFTWYDSRENLLAAAAGYEAAIAEADAPIVSESLLHGHCPVCNRDTVFDVRSAIFGGRPNLREGLRCRRCRLTARQRLVFVAMRQEIDRSGARHGALLEQISRLFRIAHAAWPWLTGSEYLGERHVGGRRYWWSARGLRWHRLRHESITALSYADSSLDLLAHSDVLEHVFELDKALREAVRVLRPGGAMLFTIPFFLDRDHSLLRGRPTAGGGIEHLAPPEYHGDGMSKTGIYAFHSLAWDLMDRMREAGFTQVEIGICHAPREGFAAADPTVAAAWLNLPMVFRAIR